MEFKETYTTIVTYEDGVKKVIGEYSNFEVAESMGNIELCKGAVAFTIIYEDGGKDEFRMLEVRAGLQILGSATRHILDFGHFDAVTKGINGLGVVEDISIAINSISNIRSELRRELEVLKKRIH